MSDFIRHECGIALIRLLKPLEFYQEKYGSALYGLNKLYLLMEKQHNRGQDGVGLGIIKFDATPGERFVERYRSMEAQPLKSLFNHIFSETEKLQNRHPEAFEEASWLKEQLPFVGELMMGHLRYGTHGENSLSTVHPFVRSNNWRTRNLVLAGNFNMTNADDLFNQLVALGQHPREKSDTITVLEKIGHFLDVENQRIFDEHKETHDNETISDIIGDKLNVQNILERSVKDFDGGYAMVGLIGHGDAFVLRDPNGIRPAYWYADDEVVIAASERPPIQTAFNVAVDAIREVPPGHALIVKKSGDVFEAECAEPREKRSCSFERIYFSRGTDVDIYKERKQLGRQLTKPVLEAVNYDLENTVFSFIPNTAEVAFNGLMKGVEDWLASHKAEQLEKGISGGALQQLLALRPRVEKVAVKDAKLRTFITEDRRRNELVSHVYDITYGSIRPGVDTLVVIDDSIVRGTTLQRSIISNLDRLQPKKIIIVSSAPQIRYPDCYGIDMSRLAEFVAFRAAIDLVREREKEDILEDIYGACLEQVSWPLERVENQVQRLYEMFNVQELTNRIAQIVRPPEMRSELQVIYQTIQGLHAACPNHTGDWYFTGNYPTPGGKRVVNRAFINFMEGKKVRAY